MPTSTATLPPADVDFFILAMSGATAFPLFDEVPPGALDEFVVNVSLYSRDQRLLNLPVSAEVSLPRDTASWVICTEFASTLPPNNANSARKRQPGHGASACVRQPVAGKPGSRSVSPMWSGIKTLVTQTTSTVVLSFTRAPWLANPLHRPYPSGRTCVVAATALTSAALSATSAALTLAASPLPPHHLPVAAAPCLLPPHPRRSPSHRPCRHHHHHHLTTTTLTATSFTTTLTAAAPAAALAAAPTAAAPTNLVTSFFFFTHTTLYHSRHAAPPPPPPAPPPPPHHRLPAAAHSIHSSWNDRASHLVGAGARVYGIPAHSSSSPSAAPRQATVEIEVDVHLHQGSMTHFECPTAPVRQREEPAGGDAAAFAGGAACGEDQSPRRDPDAQRRSDDSLSDDGLTGLRMNLTSGADSHTSSGTGRMLQSIEDVAMASNTAEEIQLIFTETVGQFHGIISARWNEDSPHTTLPCLPF